jgi:hypothetical protein
VIEIATPTNIGQQVIGGCTSLNEAFHLWLFSPYYVVDEITRLTCLWVFYVFDLKDQEFIWLLLSPPAQKGIAAAIPLADG